MLHTKEELEKSLELYLASFEKVLYEDDDKFMEGMKTNSLAHDDIEKYRFWEWTQGVGLFGVWKLYQRSHDKRYLDILVNYYEGPLRTGLPAKNVNTVTPLLALSYLAEELNDARYMAVCKEWAEWVYQDFPRTKEGGLQHLTSDSINDQELWDDTLFMTVLFLANMGRILHRQDYQEEAEYQFLLHTKYLADRKTGLWFHGWTFNGNHNFAEAFWARGNCWLTAAIPEFLSMTNCTASVKRFLTEAWRRQVEALLENQESDGMWHTLIDDKDSYVESSATCGFGYGILRGVTLGMAPQEWADSALKALTPILGYTDAEGVVHHVSYGTPMGRESKDFYKKIELRPMPYGQALAMLFFMEAIPYIAQHEYDVQER